MGSEGAGESDALALSAGKLRGRAAGEGFRAEEVEHFGDALGAGDGVEMTNAEGDILLRGEVRERARAAG